MNKFGSFDDFDQMPIRCENCGELFSIDLLSDDTFCPRCGQFIEIDEAMLNNFQLFQDDYDVFREIDNQ